jgi:hypothetical protein
MLPDSFLRFLTLHHAIKDSPTQTISFYPLINGGDISGERPQVASARAASAARENLASFKWAGADISPGVNNREKLVICIY